MPSPYRTGNTALLPPKLPRPSADLFDWGPIEPCLQSLGYQFDYQSNCPGYTPTARFRVDAAEHEAGLQALNTLDHNEQFVWISFIDTQKTDELEIYERLRVRDATVKTDSRNPLAPVVEVCDINPPGCQGRFFLIVTKEVCEDACYFASYPIQDYPSGLVAILEDVLEGLTCFHEHRVMHGRFFHLLRADKRRENNSVDHRFLLSVFGWHGIALLDNGTRIPARWIRDSGTPPECKVTSTVDALKVDMWYLGKYISSMMQTVQEMKPFLIELVAKMKDDDPQRRLSAAEALAAFHDLRESLVAEAIKLDSSTYSYRIHSGLEVRPDYNAGSSPSDQ